MNHTIDETNWEKEIEKTIELVQNGDVMMVPSVKALNAAMSVLASRRRDVFVYVRLIGWKYHPPVGVEKEVEL